MNECEKVEDGEMTERIACLPPIRVPETTSDGMFYPGNSNVHCSEEDLEEMVKLYGGDLINDRELPPPSPSPAKSIESMALEIVKLNEETAKLHFQIEKTKTLSEDTSNYVLRKLECYARSDDVEYTLQEQLKIFAHA